MRIGILTYHRSHNFGALLQAYALKMYISSLGYKVTIIDYWPSYHKEMYALWSRSNFWKRNIRYKVSAIINLIINWRKKNKKQDLIYSFIDTYIINDAVDYRINKFDIVIYGSDQIWRNQNHLTYKGFNPTYFGDMTIKSARKISYAASMGVVAMSEAEKQMVKELLLNFNSISVREENLLEELQPLTDKKIIKCIDPVFLLGKQKWANFCQKSTRNGYILVYNLQRSKELGLIVKVLKRKTNLPVVEILSEIRLFKKKNQIAVLGPKDFLSLIENADYVVTSSFHGVAFSIIFEKQFYVHQRDNVDRVKSLLKEIDLSSQFVIDPLKHNYEEQINYDIVTNRLRDYIKTSSDFLKNELNVS